MAVNLSPVAGAAAQFFDNSGNVLTGGKLYTYDAGTTTPAPTYTTSSGFVAHANPIVLNAAGRVPDSGEIWLADSVSYKFVLKDANDVLIATYDNLVGINSNFVNFTGEEETQTATQGQTVFTLATIQYQPTTNNLLVFVNGSKQIPVTNYQETSSTVVTFVDGLNVGDIVDFCTATPINTFSANAASVLYNEGGAGAVDRNVEQKLQESVSIADFGASPSNTATQNLIAFQAAVDASVDGGVLLVPSASSPYIIDTTNGLTSAIEINKRLTIVFDGDVKSNFGALQANPPCIFNVTADNVTFTGTGRLIGDGTIDDTNAGDDTTMPALVRVTGDAFTMNGVTIDTPCKIGVHLLNCAYAKIINNNFTGGPTTYTTGNTGYFGIRLYETFEINISNNQFFPDSSDGMYIQCIFSNGATYSTIENNTATKPYEKLCYLYGDYNLITGNMVVGNTGTIPGTSQGGTLTSVYRANGNYNKISNNYSQYCLAGATIMDGFGNEISNNSFIDCGQLGIAMFPNSAYTGTFNDSVISNNVITGAVITGITNTYGIFVNLNYASTENIQITNNNVSYFAGNASYGLIFLAMASPYSLSKCKVSGNRMNGGSIAVNGVYLTRVIDSMITDNYIENCSAYAMLDNGGAYNNWINNKCESIGTIGISGLATTSDCQQNQYTRASLIGTATLDNAITTTVTHGGVAPNARIFLQTANDDAGILITPKGWPTTAVSGTNFTLTMANGTTSGSTTAQFFYNIVQ